ncbi:MAG: hypothetical protein EOO43_02015 [Flavobacterium sp.]|nr:MAG: hypothetical protein EOO43_02015 [Flavobacterium sp.]
MKKIGIVLLLSCLGWIQSSFAQNTKLTFEQATLAYESGNYKESLDYLNEVERLLGKPTAKVQSLKVVIYYEQDDIHNAQLALGAYFKTSPNQNSEEYQNMVVLKQELDGTLREQYRSQLQELREKENRELQKLDKNTSGQEEAYHFSTAKSINTIEAIDYFLTKYPSSVYQQEANEMRRLKYNERDFDKLVLEGDDYILNNRPNEGEKKYLEARRLKDEVLIRKRLAGVQELLLSLMINDGNSAFYESRWTDAITNYSKALQTKDDNELKVRLEKAKQELAYELVHKDGAMQAYLKYTQDYPNGLYIYEIQAKLIEKYLDKAEVMIREANTEEAKIYLQKAWSFHPSNVFTYSDQRYFELVDREAKRLTSGKKEVRMQRIGEAIRYYTMLNDHSGKDYKGKLTQVRQKQKAWSHDDFIYLAFRSNEKIDQVGVDVGGNTNTSTGGFISARGSLKALKNSGNEPFNTDGLDYYSVFVNLNLTRKIIYPVWIYAGGGYVNYIKIDAVKDQPGKGIILDENSKGEGAFNIESGLLLKLRPFALSLGASFPQFSQSQKQLLNIKNNYVLSAAFGFSFKL